jgi:hypothetical protein
VKDLESAVENYLKKQVGKHHGLYWKFVSPSTRGVPDRLCIFPGKPTCYVELKRPGEHPRPDQIFRIGQLQKLGQPVWVVDSKEAADTFIKKYCQSDGWLGGGKL